MVRSSGGVATAVETTEHVDIAAVKAQRRATRSKTKGDVEPKRRAATSDPASTDDRRGRAAAPEPSRTAAPTRRAPSTPAPSRRGSGRPTSRRRRKHRRRACRAAGSPARRTRSRIAHGPDAGMPAPAAPAYDRRDAAARRSERTAGARRPARSQRRTASACGPRTCRRSRAGCQARADERARRGPTIVTPAGPKLRDPHGGQALGPEGRPHRDARHRRAAPGRAWRRHRRGPSRGRRRRGRRGAKMAAAHEAAAKKRRRRPTAAKRPAAGTAARRPPRARRWRSCTRACCSQQDLAEREARLEPRAGGFLKQHRSSDRDAAARTASAQTPRRAAASSRSTSRSRSRTCRRRRASRPRHHQEADHAGRHGDDQLSGIDPTKAQRDHDGYGIELQVAEAKTPRRPSARSSTTARCVDVALARAGRHDPRPRRPRQDQPARQDPQRQRRRGRGRRHHAAHRARCSVPRRRCDGEKKQRHVHRHARPPGVHRHARPRREHDRRGRAGRVGRRRRHAADDRDRSTTPGRPRCRSSSR